MPRLVDAFRLPRWIAGSRADAKDIVQEASMRAFKKIRGFSGGDPRAWVLTIVRNTSYSWLAKNRPKAVVLSEDLNQGARERIEREATDETQTPEAALIAKLEAQHVRKAMASLPAPFHEVLVLTNSAARAASGGTNNGRAVALLRPPVLIINEAAGGDHDGDGHDYRARRLRYDGAGDKSLAQGRDGAHRHL